MKELLSSTAQDLLDAQDKFDQAVKSPPICQKCKSPQMQIMDWVHEPPVWKCRICKHYQ